MKEILNLRQNDKKTDSVRMRNVCVASAFVVLWLVLIFGGTSTKVVFIDKEGNEVLGLNYEECSIFSEGLAAVRRDRKWGFIDNRGVLITPPTFSEARPYHNGLSLVVHHGKVGFIGHKGQFQILPKYEKGSDFSEEMAAVAQQPPLQLA